MADSQIVPLNKKSKPSDDESEFDFTNCFDELPQETVIDILSRLPIKSLMQFTFTSRTLNPLSHDPHLVKRHLARSDSSSSRLIIHSKFPLGNQLYLLQLSDQKLKEFHVPFAQSMPTFNIIGSSTGLLCLTNSQFSDSICIYNPFTRDYFELPKHLDDPYQVVVHGFGFDPVACDYKVVKMAYYGGIYYRHLCSRKGYSQMDIERLFNSNQSSQVTVYSKRSNAWVNKGIIPYKIETCSSTAVLASGRLHWVSVLGKHEGFDSLQCLIVSYGLVDHEFRAIKGPCYRSGNETNSRHLSYHLSELDGSLCASVPSEFESFDIWVMEEYGVEESWTKKYSIGQYNSASIETYQMEKGRHFRRNLYRKNVKVVCISEGGEVVLEYSRKGSSVAFDPSKQSFRELEHGERPGIGEVILKYRGGALVAYDPCEKSFRELEYEGMPRIYHATAHVGSLLPANL